GIFTSISGSAPNRIFNIEWRAAYFSSQSALNFELRLYENSPRLDMIYGTLNGTGSSATVGVQHGTQATSFECNNGGLASGLQLTFQPGGCPDGGGGCLPPATTIVTPILSGSNLSFSFATVAGFNYTVLYKDSLGDPTWQVLQTVPGDGTLKIINVSATTPAQRFYRISAQ
ncbi:MAG: hypothetical protein ACREIC_27395, partial [Limisphaerales bacterium]